MNWSGDGGGRVATTGNNVNGTPARRIWADPDCNRKTGYKYYRKRAVPGYLLLSGRNDIENVQKGPHSQLRMYVPPGNPS